MLSQAPIDVARAWISNEKKETAGDLSMWNRWLPSWLCCLVQRSWLRSLKMSLASHSFCEEHSCRIWLLDHPAAGVVSGSAQCLRNGHFLDRFRVLFVSIFFDMRPLSLRVT